jgi:hypothetical protein
MIGGLEKVDSILKPNSDGPMRDFRGGRLSGAGSPGRVVSAPAGLCKSESFYSLMPFNR